MLPTAVWRQRYEHAFCICSYRQLEDVMQVYRNAISSARSMLLSQEQSMLLPFPFCELIESADLQKRFPLRSTSQTNITAVIATYFQKA